ncbi:MAG TPA: Spy/CpxP family protein refolding chaperone [Methylocella sp.]|nr:Spy/CpxP family protein refolding chaperone [Methylocella sp.]
MKAEFVRCMFGPRFLFGLCLSTAIAFAPLYGFAQTPSPGEGDMKDQGAMGSEETGGPGMMGGGMMGGGMMGGSPEQMRHKMSKMHERLAKAPERVAALKTELKITDAQMPAWNKFSDAVLAAAKSMDESMQSMHKHMQSGMKMSLPEQVSHRLQMMSSRVAAMQSIKEALDPLYASFSDEQKKIADKLKIGPMGVM